MDTIEEGCFVTIAVGEHETRAKVQVVYRQIGSTSRYFVVSPLFIGWILETEILNSNNRSNRNANVNRTG